MSSHKFEEKLSALGIVLDDKMCIRDRLWDIHMIFSEKNTR